MNELFQTVLVYALPVIFAITVHEGARAYVARYFGDTTPEAAGRLTLNPINHIDPLGTIIFPAVLYLATGGAFLFGYAKRLPLNPGQMRDPKKNLKWLALSGPAANFSMAVLWALFGIVLSATHVNESFFVQMASAGVMTNIAMCAFHLIPILPMAGGQVIFSLLPSRQAYQFAKVEPYGFLIVLGLAILHLLQYWMVPVMVMQSVMLNLLLSPLRAILG